MNGCKVVTVDFDVSGYLYRDCGRVVSSGGNTATTGYYKNLNYLTINGNNHELRVCKYDSNYNAIGGVDYISRVPNGYRYNLDPNYYYRFSKSNSTNSFLAYNCNDTLKDMSIGLVTGSSSFSSTLDVIIPFIVVIIGFAIAFKILSSLVKRGDRFNA